MPELILQRRSLKQFLVFLIPEIVKNGLIPFATSETAGANGVSLS
jgi:hypothetical protein